MRQKILLTGILLLGFLGGSACSVLRPILFWRDCRIVGHVKLVDENGVPLQKPAAGVIFNFINLGGRIEDSVLSAQSDATGKYASPKLKPGSYKVEAMLANYVIESATIKVKSHEHKKFVFTLKKIREGQGRSLRESEQDNIPNPGEVQITPPPF
jgi:hypothetical protein